ncbi:lytic murein transglycosylase [Pseudidiomarina aestuarii]|uniref:Lytic murein transglycosylase n=1 Tax=Pseudidiomarina aestuarii TaxID=624146 RepID=A0A7Z6ZU22_9GAMM|nr:lytic murein transglycosylase [Pseudidiomarina aestuarii]RUO41315.1 lytic murein transglycosylase [Pseudidiomarina aestuarii]
MMKKLQGWVVATGAAVVLSWSPLASSADEADFPAYVDKIKAEARAAGYTEDTLNRAFAGVKFYKKSVEADKNQPEFKLTLDTYLPRAVPEWKADKAVEMYAKHRDLLDKIGAEYGVQPRFIVALWGIETNFGSYTGGFDVISALTTMAFEGRREEFFKKQLWHALTIVQENHIDVEQMQGSWAGAMGQTQFMPSSFMQYAVDYDGDGRKDIWGSMGDVFASAANYLKSVGWQDDVTWGRQVQIPGDFDESLAGLNTKKTLAEWQALGIRRMDGNDLPNRSDLEASVVIPDDKQGRVYLAYANYDALMRWNRSHYFVAAVGYLSDRIRFPR